MSSPGNDLPLRILTFIAIVFAIVGGSFYFGAVLRDDKPRRVEPDRTEVETPARAPARASSTPAPRDSGRTADRSEPAEEQEASDGPMQPQRDALSPALMSMATRPTVLPEEELAGVEEELALGLEDIDRCWRGAVGDNATEGKVFVHFTVDENGEVADLTVRSKGIGVPSVNICFTDAAGKRVFGNTEPGTSVYWPILLDPETGPRLR